ncbi:RNA polymerase B [Polyrhizophydium stewartii]|uniref:RNA polymerase B n=1 Tax=Polyrhizophydium stewartii TaxID=2732419 RepID=A0ABR4N8X7_9FUNG
MSAIRKRRQAQEEEDANQVKLGPDFQTVDCLLISEVKVLLDIARDRKRRESGEGSISDIMQKTFDYCQQSTRFSNKQVVKEIRALFPKDQFHEFEMVQLANLCCETAEEAKALIPR